MHRFGVRPGTGIPAFVSLMKYFCTRLATCRRDGNGNCWGNKSRPFCSCIKHATCCGARAVRCGGIHLGCDRATCCLLDTAETCIRSAEMAPVWPSCSPARLRSSAIVSTPPPRVGTWGAAAPVFSTVNRQESVLTTRIMTWAAVYRALDMKTSSS